DNGNESVGASILVINNNANLSKIVVIDEKVSFVETGNKVTSSDSINFEGKEYKLFSNIRLSGKHFTSTLRTNMEDNFYYSINSLEKKQPQQPTISFDKNRINSSLLFYIDKDKFDNVYVDLNIPENVKEYLDKNFDALYEETDGLNKILDNNGCIPNSKTECQENVFKTFGKYLDMMYTTDFADCLNSLILSKYFGELAQKSGIKINNEVIRSANTPICECFEKILKTIPPKKLISFNGNRREFSLFLSEKAGLLVDAIREHINSIPVDEFKNVIMNAFKEISSLPKFKGKFRINESGKNMGVIDIINSSNDIDPELSRLYGEINSAVKMRIDGFLKSAENLGNISRKPCLDILHIMDKIKIEQQKILSERRSFEQLEIGKKSRFMNLLNNKVASLKQDDRYSSIKDKVKVFSDGSIGIEYNVNSLDYSDRPNFKVINIIDKFRQEALDSAFAEFMGSSKAYSELTIDTLLENIKRLNKKLNNDYLLSIKYSQLMLRQNKLSSLLSNDKYKALKDKVDIKLDRNNTHVVGFKETQNSDAVDIEYFSLLRELQQEVTSQAIDKSKELNLYESSIYQVSITSENNLHKGIINRFLKEPVSLREKHLKAKGVTKNFMKGGKFTGFKFKDNPINNAEQLDDLKITLSNATECIINYLGNEYKDNISNNLRKSIEDELEEIDRIESDFLKQIGKIRLEEAEKLVDKKYSEQKNNLIADETTYQIGVTNNFEKTEENIQMLEDIQQESMDEAIKISKQILTEKGQSYLNSIFEKEKELNRLLRSKIVSEKPVHSPKPDDALLQQNNESKVTEESLIDSAATTREQSKQMQQLESASIQERSQIKLGEPQQDEVASPSSTQDSLNKVQSNKESLDPEVVITDEAAESTEPAKDNDLSNETQKKSQQQDEAVNLSFTQEPEVVTTGEAQKLQSKEEKDSPIQNSEYIKMQTNNPSTMVKLSTSQTPEETTEVVTNKAQSSTENQKNHKKRHHKSKTKQQNNQQIIGLRCELENLLGEADNIRIAIQEAITEQNNYKADSRFLKRQDKTTFITNKIAEINKNSSIDTKQKRKQIATQIAAYIIAGNTDDKKLGNNVGKLLKIGIPNDESIDEEINKRLSDVMDQLDIFYLNAYKYIGEGDKSVRKIDEDNASGLDNNRRGQNTIEYYYNTKTCSPITINKSGYTFYNKKVEELRTRTPLKDLKTRQEELQQQNNTKIPNHSTDMSKKLRNRHNKKGLRETEEGISLIKK
ncbi:MAG: hypothetical protein LBC92_04750, partial [Rickettsiales bacterium]|nr:hypothetical protein [Rickettsiales bacterium]